MRERDSERWKVLGIAISIIVALAGVVGVRTFSDLCKKVALDVAEEVRRHATIKDLVEDAVRRHVTLATRLAAARSATSHDLGTLQQAGPTLDTPPKNSATASE